MLQSLIVGYGRAGRELHLPCLTKARLRTQQEGLFAETVGIVDPRVPELVVGAGSRTIYFDHLSAAQDFDPGSTVVHVCTPPSCHLSVIRQAVDLGYKKIIVEKPLVTSEEELAAVRGLARKSNAQILVVAHLLSSALTARIKNMIDSGEFGQVRRLTVRQCKPRFSRTLANSGHCSAYDVETPHQVALALHLAGPVTTLEDARISDMRIGEQVIRGMGSARMRLRHAGGAKSLLCSDLTSHVRTRRLELESETRMVVGHYPPGADDSYASLEVHDGRGRVVASELLEDDALTNCLLEFYSYLGGRAARPVSDLVFNIPVVSLICDAKKRSCIESAIELAGLSVSHEV